MDNKTIHLAFVQRFSGFTWSISTVIPQIAAVVGHYLENVGIPQLNINPLSMLASKSMSVNIC